MSSCKVLLFARPLPNPAAPWSPIWFSLRLRERGGAIDQVLLANPFHSHISHTRHHPHSTNHTPPSCPTSPHTRASPPIPMRRSLHLQCDHGRKADQPCIREVHRPCVGVGAGCMSGRVWVCTCVSVFVCVCMSACGCVVCLGRDQEVSRGEN